MMQVFKKIVNSGSTLRVSMAKVPDLQCDSRPPRRKLLVNSTSKSHRGNHSTEVDHLPFQVEGLRRRLLGRHEIVILQGVRIT